MAPRKETRLTRVEPSESSTSNEVRELGEQVAALIDIVQQQADAFHRQEEASRHQEKASKCQAEQIQKLQKKIA